MKLHVVVTIMLRKISDEDLHQFSRSHRINSRRPIADDLFSGLTIIPTSMACKHNVTVSNEETSPYSACIQVLRTDR